MSNVGCCLSGWWLVVCGFTRCFSLTNFFIGQVHFSVKLSFVGEFDPGSGRTLAACFIHASRTTVLASVGIWSGERVSNT